MIVVARNDIQLDVAAAQQLSSEMKKDGGSTGHAMADGRTTSPTATSSGAESELPLRRSQRQENEATGIMIKLFPKL